MRKNMYSIKLLILINFVGITNIFATNINDDEINVERKKITSLSENCMTRGSMGRCRNFNYTSTGEVAYFDLPIDVRITPDEDTYSLGNQLWSYDTLIFENSTFTRFPLGLFQSAGGGISELNMRGCFLTTIDPEAFDAAQNLLVLLLSHNRLQRLRTATFAGAKRLQYLWLGANELTELDSDSFVGLRQLLLLDLSDNHMSVLHDDIFRHLPALTTLNLDGNQLRHISGELFRANVNLRLLSVQRNIELRSIAEHALNAQARIEHVDFSHNPRLTTLVLSKLRAHALHAANCTLSVVKIYGSVTNVDLCDNVHLTELYFARPELLRALTLRNTALKQVAAVSLAVGLRHLDLSDNPGLSQLALTASLESLDLRNTSLRSLPDFTQLRNLRKLNIAHNRMREIPPEDLPQLRNLTHFFLHANDWNCHNLHIIMDTLIQPKGITYESDAKVASFPGEYVHGVACMYRLPYPDSESAESTNTHSEQVIAPVTALEEVKALRSELKAIVQIYEEKFDRVFDILSELRAELTILGQLNSTQWREITINLQH